MVGAALLLAGLAGCGRSAEDLASTELQSRLDAVHDAFLDGRAQRPSLTGVAAQRSLDQHGRSVATWQQARKMLGLRAA